MFRYFTDYRREPLRHDFDFVTTFRYDAKRAQARFQPCCVFRYDTPCAGFYAAADAYAPCRLR